MITASEALDLSIEPWAAVKKAVAVSPAPVRVQSQRPFAPNVALVTSVANDRVDDKIIPGAVHRSPGIHLTAEETPRNLQIGDRR